MTRGVEARTPIGKPKTLTPKQMKAIEYYYSGESKSESYRKAYPGKSSEKTIHHNAYQFFKHPLIVAEMERRDKAILSKLDVTQEKVLMEMARIGFLDIRRLFNTDGTMKQIIEMHEDDARAIASFEVDEITMGSGADKVVIGQSKKVKLYSKPEVLKTLAQYLKMIGPDEAANKTPPALVSPEEQRTAQLWLEKYGTLPPGVKSN